VGEDKPKMPVQGNSEAAEREKFIREWRKKNPKKKKKSCCL
jgi:hypothetical protein